MTAANKNPALLPSGFIDLLPPDAEREYAAVGRVMQIFAAFGYERVKPPLLEFEESLFSGPGAAMEDQTFRVMDPVSHRMMGLRSDITPQIARIASSRLAGEKRPLRLTYANDVLRTKGSQQRIERQFCQVGCEIIGDSDIEADIESCVIALIGLGALGVKDITIDLAYPEIIKTVLKDHKVKDEEAAFIRAALAKRNLDGVKGKVAAQLKSFMNVAGPADKALKKLDTMKLTGALKKDANQFAAVYEGIARAIDELGMDNVSVTIDPVEERGFKYYSGLGFTLFAKGVAGALGRGGRYDVHFEGKTPRESATGFTLYMDTVRKAMPPGKEKTRVNVGYDESWAHIREQQLKGAVVVRGKKRK